MKASPSHRRGMSCQHSVGSAGYKLVQTVLATGEHGTVGTGHRAERVTLHWNNKSKIVTAQPNLSLA